VTDHRPPVSMPIPHPVAGVMAELRMTNRRLGSAIGKSAKHVGQVKLNLVPATPEFRAAVCGVLGMAESELFHPAVSQPRRPAHPGDESLPVDGLHGKRGNRHAK
jgi:hypothetical protein